MKRFILSTFAIIAALTIGFVGQTATTHAQTYGGGGQFTFYSNANGQYWCYANGDVTFQSVSGVITWSVASQPNAIQCPIPAQVAAPYVAPVTVAAPVTYAQPTPPVIVINADPCANNNAYGYANVNPFGYGLGNPYGAGFAYGYNNGCGQNFNAGFGCLAFGCRNNFPNICNFPGSCQQGLPPHHDHDHVCPAGQTFHESTHSCS